MTWRERRAERKTRGIFTGDAESRLAHAQLEPAAFALGKETARRLHEYNVNGYARKNRWRRKYGL